MPNTVGIRREDLSRIGEQRCAIAPPQAQLMLRAGGHLLVQPALEPESQERKRVFDDEEYSNLGARILEDISSARIIVGLKEVDVARIEDRKVYLCFSHTHKGQAKNRSMLRTMTEAKTSLIDYELIEDSTGRRLLTAFTYFAGYAGVVDTLWTFGRRLKAEGISSPFEEIPQSIDVADLPRIRDILSSAGRRIEAKGTPESIPPVVVCVLGRGKTSSGVQELLDLLPTAEIDIDSLPDVIRHGTRRCLHKLVLEVDEMYRLIGGHEEERKVFDGLSPSDRISYYLDHPHLFESNMEAILPYASMVLNCILWSDAYPRTIPSELMSRIWDNGTPLRVIGDITCDPNGSIEFSRETWIDEPVFTYDPSTERHLPGLRASGLAVMAVTNLPCEFSRDASMRFSKELEPFLANLLETDFDDELETSGLCDELRRATILWNGQLTASYEYMTAYL